ncbi:MAG TPA: 2-phosphosulfolactate phosphatase [Ktedonobacteraceae bacterium]|nr:2-phosphosulfolactate phosphatase [Ktedonobacteraceae bacterium]
MQHTPIILRVTREQAEQAEGIVVVIDVIRAFTVAAYAFAGGAACLWLVRTVEEALALREREPDALLAGEIGGRLIPGFDLNNSPSTMARANVQGKHVIQRTGAGTQGAVGARNSTHLLTASLAVASATARYVARLSANTGLPITFLPTETSAGGILRNEDKYCADYIEALITQPETAADVLSDRLARLHAEGRFYHWGAEKDEDFPLEDLEQIQAADRFDFVMLGKRLEYQGFSYVELTATQIP